ncbi:MAG: hypothetical protein IKW89_13905 [Bacteroidales bacterium]|nr:hypothetical protein [Bacteroidales bacterium]
MKRILTTLALACMTFFAVAQNSPFGMKMEIAEVGQDDNEYSIFTYQDPDGALGYYLGVGHEFDLLRIFGDDLSSSFSLVDETALVMGETMDDAFAFLDSLLELLEEAPGTTAAFPCRLTTGADQLFAPSTAHAVVVKRFLQAKRLSFLFESGGHTAEVDLTKSAIKSLRWNLELYRKLHPNG